MVIFVVCKKPQNTNKPKTNTKMPFPPNYNCETSLLTCNTDQYLSFWYLFPALIFRSFNKDGEQRVGMTQRNGNGIRRAFHL